jgi:hypothetical protein
MVAKFTLRPAARAALVVGFISLGSVPSRSLSSLRHHADRVSAFTAAHTPSSGTIAGRVTYEGTPKKPKPIEMANEPSCARLYATPLLPEDSITGPNSSLPNVIVFISEGAPEEKDANPQPVQLTQHGCRYLPHILVAISNQEVWVKNEDPVTHSIHFLTQTNRESNRSQPPGTPPLSLRFARPEFIRVKCDIHPWMHSILAVFKNSHYAVTDSKGVFALPNLPPGHYTVTAWHEAYGTQSKEITVSPGESQDLNFVFKVTPY